MKALDGCEFEKHKAEAREKWGQTDAYKEYTEKTGNYSGQKWNDVTAGMDRIMAAFAACMGRGEGPESAGAQGLVQALQEYITENYYRCSNEILTGLGQMYASDPRFRANIDRHADGTAAFICQTIRIYCGE